MNKELDRLCAFGCVEKDGAVLRKSSKAGFFYIELTDEMLSVLSDVQLTLLKSYTLTYLKASSLNENGIKRLKTKDSTWESFLTALDGEVAKKREKEEKSREERRFYEECQDRKRKEREESIAKDCEEFKKDPERMLSYSNTGWSSSPEVGRLPDDHFLKVWSKEEVLRRNASRQEFEKTVKDDEENKNSWIVQAFLNDHGTVSQKERFLENLLPEEELINLAKDVFFAEYDQHFEKFSRYSRKEVNDYLNDLNEAYDLDDSEIDRRYKDDSSSAMTGFEWEAWKKISDLSKSRTNVTIERKWHDAGPENDCNYDRYLLAKKYVKVTISWAGRKLSKCYLLDCKEQVKS